ncbi:MAG: helix-turn-helix transcriptional regulator [Myxococcales bacterium]|nr:helix-turn-helix transcriptional regulator [Myxococcales bacterium]
MIHVGLALRRLRLESGVGLRDLARRLGVSSAYVSRIEHGHDADPTPERLRAMAEVLELPPSVLLEVGRRIGPWVAEHVERSPEAAALFLALVRRGLDPAEWTEVRRFVEARFPIAQTSPQLAPMLVPNRVMLGVEGASLDDIHEMAAGRLDGDTQALLRAFRDHERAVGAVVGHGVLVPVARGPWPLGAALLVLEDPLFVRPDEVSVVLALALPSDVATLPYVAQAARLAARGLTRALAGTHGHEPALEAIERLESG